MTADVKLFAGIYSYQMALEIPEHIRVDAQLWGERLAAVTKEPETDSLISRCKVLGIGIGLLGIAQIGALVTKSQQDSCAESVQIECYLQAAGLPAVEGAQPTLPPAEPEIAAASQVSPVEAQPDDGVIKAEQLPDLGIPWLPPSVRYWGNEIIAAAAEYQVDPQLVSIIVTLESGGWPEAASPANAQGLMQIWPPTGQSLAASLGLAEGQYDLFDPATNIRFGALKLRQLLNVYQPLGEITPSDYTIQLVATGYNGGEGRINNLMAGLPIPRETAVYSNYAVELWQQRLQPTSAAFERWQSPEYGNGNTLITKANESFAARGIRFG